MFKYVRSIGGVGRKLERVLLASSTAFKVGDVIETQTTGVGLPVAAAKPALGVILDFCDAKGLPLRESAIVAGTAGGNSVQSLTTGGSNVSIFANVDISSFTVYSADVTGTIGTTATSGKRGIKINIDSAGTKYGFVLESTATRTPATITNFTSLGVDPQDATRLLVVIANSELENQ
jgi:hypothetical protein